MGRAVSLILDCKHSLSLNESKFLEIERRRFKNLGNGEILLKG